MDVRNNNVEGSIDRETIGKMIGAGCHLFPAGGGEDGKLPAPGFLQWDKAQATVLVLDKDPGNRNWAIVPAKGPCPAMVVDVDNPDLFSDIVDIADEYGLAPFANLESLTPGHKHLWFRIPRGLTVDNGLWGVDRVKGGEIRASNGFVVMPGKKYNINLAQSFRDGYYRSDTTEEQINAFLAKIKGYKKDKDVHSFPITSSNVTNFPSSIDYSQAQLREALFCISPDEGYDDWIVTSMAFKRAGGNEADWVQWCGSGKEEHRRNSHLAKHWRSIEGGDVTVGTLIAKAKTGGFRPKRRSRLDGQMVNQIDTTGNVEFINELSEVEHGFNEEQAKWLARNPVSEFDVDGDEDGAPLGIVPGRQADGTETSIDCIDFPRIMDRQADICAHAEVAQFEAWLASQSIDYNRRHVVPDRFVEGIGWRRWYAGYGWKDISASIAQNHLSARARKYVGKMATQGSGDNKEVVFAAMPDKANDEVFTRKVLGLMEGYYPFLTSFSDWDSDPLLIGHPDAMVTDLRNGVTRPQKPDDLIMRRTAVLPATSEDAQDNDVTVLLGRMFPDARTRFAFLCDISTGLVGENIHDLVIAFEGVGGSGKSTLTGAINKSLGTYSKGLNPGVIYDAVGKTYIDPYDVAADRVAMQWLRFGLIQEVGTSGSYRLNNDKLKQISGGDEFTTRLARTSHQVVVTPKLTPMFVGNELPTARIFDPAVRRRLKLYRTAAKLQDNNDIYFRKKIQSKDNLSILLRILIDHYAQVMQHGGALPPIAPEVAMWTKEWLEKEDALMQFIADCVEKASEDSFVTTINFIKAMKDYCEANELEFPKELDSSKSMNSKLKTHGFTKNKIGRNIVIGGIKLNI